MPSTVRISRAQPLAGAADSTRCALAAAALGFLILWVVGFSPMHAVHDAAHDTRHIMAFPCH